MCLDEEIFLDELILLQNLHGVRLPIVNLPHQIDFSKRASANHSQKLEVIDGYLGAWLQDVLGGTIIILVTVIIDVFSVRVAHCGGSSWHLHICRVSWYLRLNTVHFV